MLFSGFHGDNHDIAPISVATPLWIHEIEDAYNQFYLQELSIPSLQGHFCLQEGLIKYIVCI